VETKAPKPDQTQSEHQVTISQRQSMFADLVIPKQPKPNKGNVGDGVDEFGDVLAVLIITFAPERMGMKQADRLV
jgi:hypothetical protein